MTKIKTDQRQQENHSLSTLYSPVVPPKSVCLLTKKAAQVKKLLSFVSLTARSGRNLKIGCNHCYLIRLYKIYYQISIFLRVGFNTMFPMLSNVFFTSASINIYCNQVLYRADFLSNNDKDLIPNFKYCYNITMVTSNEVIYSSYHQYIRLSLSQTLSFLLIIITIYQRLGLIMVNSILDLLVLKHGI